MHALLRQHTLGIGIAVLLLAVITGWAAEESFQRFQERLEDQVPAERLPTLEMLREDAAHRFTVQTPQEADQICEAFAEVAGLLTCTARSTTYFTAEGEKTDWHCVCR